MKRLFFLSMLMLLLAMGCNRKDGMSQKLDSIDRLCDSDPRLAISMLDSIDPAEISSKDRHYYDLLTIKSRDKAYIRHTSDSLILDVIDYYTRHRKEGLYAQALYYGGRVYSDLGDLPTALEYFQKALDCKPEIDQNLQFKSTVLSQAGRLLLSLRLESSAITYLEKTLDIYNDIRDDYALAFTYELLGNAHLNAGDNQAALQDIAKAVRMSASLSDEDRYSIEVSLAHILQTTGNLDSALNVIRNLPEKVDELTLSYSLATAAQIYRDANILDTCYMYARQLTLLKEPANRRTGYAVIFSDALKDYVPKDTLLALIPEYKKTIEEYLDRNEGENAISQHTKYNYDLHVKQREKAQQQLFLSLIVLAAMVILTLGCFTWIFYDKFRRADKSISFMTAIKLLKEEKDNGELTSGADNGAESTINTPKFSDIKKNILSKISSGNMDSSVISPRLRNSDLYKELEEKIKREANITTSEETQIWSELKTLVESVSPGFDYRLQVLTEGRMTSNEHRMAMLIKCGFTNKECSILFGRQKSTISSHRRNLASKITGERKSDSTLDRLIISL